MLRTIDKGVRRKGVVTSSYPAERYEPHDMHKGAPALEASKCKALGDCARTCPTGAISLSEGRLTLDLGACLFCGECALACPEGAMRMTKEFELASRSREGMVRTYVVGR